MPPPSNLAPKFELYLEFLMRGTLPLAAAKAAKLDARHVRERRRTDPEFIQDEQDAIGVFAEKMEQVIIDAAFGVREQDVDEHGDPAYTNGDIPRPIYKQKDTAAAERWLKARARAVWNPDATVKVQHTHTVDLKELFQDIGGLRAELERRRELQRGAIDAESYEEGDDDG